MIVSRPYMDRHPHLFVALLEAAVVGVYLASGLAAHVFRLTGLALYALANVVLAVLSVLLLSALGWWRRVGFCAPRRGADVAYFVIPLLPVLVNLVPGLAAAGWMSMLLIGAFTLLVGFVEESIFRGLMLTALKPVGLWQAALLTALLFGFTHAMNVLGGNRFTDDLAQVAYASAIGFAYAALVLRKGLLWPLVLAHAMIDWTQLLQKPGVVFSPAANAAVALGTVVIFTIYGLFVMREVLP